LALELKCANTTRIISSSDLEKKSTATASGNNGPEFLFDVGRGADTTFCPRSKRDSWYEPRLKAQVTAWSNGNAVLQGVDKRLGSSSVNICSRDYGLGARELEEYTRRTKAPVEFEASPHSRRSILDQQVSPIPTPLLFKGGAAVSRKAAVHQGRAAGFSPESAVRPPELDY